MNSNDIQLLLDSIPDEINGWEAIDDWKKYTKDNLYDYIDGGAELYISYNFKDAYSRVYSNENQPDLRIEIFDMSEPKNAFGVFSLSSERNDSLIGQGSQYIEGSMIFWKSRYFISIMAINETEDSKNLIFNLAKIIGKNIIGEGEIPAIVKLLPEYNLKKESIIYFHNHVWQNTYYFLSSDNIFNIDSNCNAALATYEQNNFYCNIIVIDYPDRETAQAAHFKFTIDFFNETDNENIIQLEDGKWLLAELTKNHLIIVFNSRSKDFVYDVTNSIIANIPNY